MDANITFEEYKDQISEAVTTNSGLCPVCAALSVFNGKWKLSIIYELDGILVRKQFNEIPPHVEYSLTEKGEDLLPVFYALTMWGLKYIP